MRWGSGLARNSKIPLVPSWFLLSSLQVVGKSAGNYYFMINPLNLVPWFNAHWDNILLMNIFHIVKTRY